MTPSTIPVMQRMTIPKDQSWRESIMPPCHHEGMMLYYGRSQKKKHFCSDDEGEMEEVSLYILLRTYF